MPTPTKTSRRTHVSADTKLVIAVTRASAAQVDRGRYPHRWDGDNGHAYFATSKKLLSKVVAVARRNGVGPA